MIFGRAKKNREEPLRMVSERPETLDKIPKELLTPKSVRYINEVVRYGGVIATLRRGEEYLSIACLTCFRDVSVLGCVLTAEKHRRKGYATTLVRELTDAVGRQKPIAANINRKKDADGAAEKLLRKTGFTEKERFTNYVFESEALTDPLFIRRLEQTKRIEEVLTGRGYRCLPLAEAPEYVVDQLRNSHANDFRNTLGTGRLLSLPGYILKDHSFLLLDDNGDLIAYSLLSRSVVKDEYQFDQMAAAEAYRGTGYVLIPVLRSIEMIVASGAKRVTFQVTANNSDSRNTVENLCALPHNKFDMQSFALDALI